MKKKELFEKNLVLTINFVIIFSIQFSFSQNKGYEKIKVFWEQLENGNYNVYATNSYYCPSTIKVNFIILKNMNVTVDIPYQGTINSLTEKQILFSIIPEPNKECKFSYECEYFRGDPENTNHDDNYKYILPYEHNKSFKVYQGYGGKFSHNSKNRKYAVDFTMPLGTKICASRSGIVVHVKENSNKGGPDKKKYFQRANEITIYQDDGTFANYVHLKKNGSLVSEGDTINAGDVIGLSGNTGWTSGPHLHFEVYYMDSSGKMISVPTKFLQSDLKLTELFEGNNYVSYHP